MCGCQGTWKLGPVVQLVRTPPCHGGGQGFESPLGRFFVLGLATKWFSAICWGLSSAGRAPALQAGGHRFEPCRPHIYRQSSDYKSAAFENLADMAQCLSSESAIRERQSSDYKSAASKYLPIWRNAYRANLRFARGRAAITNQLHLKNLPIWLNWQSS